MKTNARKNPFIRVMVVKALIEISENDKYKEFILRGKLIGFKEVNYVLLKDVISVMEIISENKNKMEKFTNHAVGRIIRNDLNIRMHRTNKGFAVILDVEAEKAKLVQILNLWRDEGMSDLDNLRKLLILLEQADEIIREKLKIRMHRTNKGFAVILDIEVEKAKLVQILNLWRDESMSDLENLRKLLILLEQADEVIEELDRDTYEEFKNDLCHPIGKVKANLQKVEKVKMEIVRNIWDENSYHL